MVRVEWQKSLQKPEDTKIILTMTFEAFDMEILVLYFEYAALADLLAAGAQYFACQKSENPD